MADKKFYYVTPHGQVKDNTGKTYGTDHYTRQIALAKDGTLWALCKQEPNENGGMNVNYWFTKNNMFSYGMNTTNLPGGYKITQGRGDDWVWFITEKGAISQISPSDHHPEMFSSYNFVDISVDNTKNGEFWGIIKKMDSNNDGFQLIHGASPNPKDISIISVDTNPKQIFAYNGNCYIVDEHNAVIAVTKDNSHGSWAKPGSALSVSAGGAGLFIVSTEMGDAGNKSYGNLIKQWNSETSSFENVLDEKGNPILGVCIVPTY